MNAISFFRNYTFRNAHGALISHRRTSDIRGGNRTHSDIRDDIAKLGQRDKGHKKILKKAMA